MERVVHTVPPGIPMGAITEAAAITTADRTVISDILAGMTMEYGAGDTGIMAGITVDQGGGGSLEGFGITTPSLFIPIPILTSHPLWCKICRPPQL